MIPTIFTSFLFLIPIYFAHIKGDTMILFILIIAMGISIANHSHTFHGNKFRRHLFKNIDMTYMFILALYTLYIASFKFNYMIIIFVILLNYMIYSQLGDYSDMIENYNTNQQYLHILFHIIGIATITCVLI